MITRSKTVEVWAGNNVHGRAVTHHGEVENRDDPPVYHERADVPYQLPEEEQKAELDRADAAPSQDQANGGHLLIIPAPLEDIRRDDQGRRDVSEYQGLGQVHVVEESESDHFGRDETADAEQQEGIINEDPLLHTDTDIESATGTDQADGEQDQSGHLFEGLTIMTVWLKGDNRSDAYNKSPS